MTDYISKPLREVELLELINRYVRPATGNDQSPASPVKFSESKGFDHQYLLDISKGKPEVLREMIALFKSQSNKELIHLSDALQASNFSEVAAIAHSMKSTVGYMGFGEMFGDLLNNMETEAKREVPNEKNLYAMLDDIRKSHTEAENFLQQIKMD